MNNRYLYKGKRTDNGEWVAGNRIDDGVTGQVFIHAVGNSVKCLRFVAFEVDPATLSQCTGYKGIWENDIFQCDDERYRIVFSEDSLTWRAESIFSSESIELGEFADYEIDVIGNAFDNPELMEVE